MIPSSNPRLIELCALIHELDEQATKCQNELDRLMAERGRLFYEWSILCRQLGYCGKCEKRLENCQCFMHAYVEYPGPYSIGSFYYNQHMDYMSSLMNQTKAT